MQLTLPAHWGDGSMHMRATTQSALNKEAMGSERDLKDESVQVGRLRLQHGAVRLAGQRLLPRPHLLHAAQRAERYICASTRYSVTAAPSSDRRAVFSVGL